MRHQASPRPRSRPRFRWLAALLALWSVTAFVPAASAQFGEIFDGIRNISNPPVILPIEHPPKLWMNVQRVIFADTQGACADEIVAILRQEFVQRGVVVVDRSQLDTVMQEHGLIRSRLIEKETAIQLGKILGGTTLITLDVQRCEDEKTQWSRRGEKGSTYYAKSWVYVKGAAQVIDLETTRIFSSEVFEQDDGEQASSSAGRPEHPAIFPIHDQVVRRAALEVVKLLFSWEEGVEIPFFDDKRCGLKDVYRRLTVGDYEGAESGAIAAVDACASKKPKHQARAYYDLGVTQFLQARYPEALDSFEQAYSLDPDRRTRKPVVETQRAIEVFERMNGYRGFLEEGGASQVLQEIGIQGAAEEAESSEKREGVRERLKELKSLYDDGLISKEDYEAKRAEILKDL